LINQAPTKPELIEKLRVVKDNTMYWKFYNLLRLKVFLRLLSFFLSLFDYSLAQTWHAITEFYRLYSRSITAAAKCSRKVAPGQAIFFPQYCGTEQSGAKF